VKNLLKSLTLQDAPKGSLLFCGLMGDNVLITSLITDEVFLQSFRGS
jgi:hypothetical protein